MPSINRTIAATTQDVQTATIFGTGGGFTSAPLKLYVGISGVLNVRSGLAYSNITVPQGATINSATLTTYGGALTGTNTIKIYGDDQDTAGNFTAALQIKNITKTSASTTVNTSAGTQTQDVTSIVQEIVNRAGWVSGNGIRFGISGTAVAGTNVWQFYDLSGGTPAALDITYTVANGNIKTIDGIAIANIKTFNGIAIANIKTFNGVVL